MRRRLFSVSMTTTTTTFGASPSSSLGSDPSSDDVSVYYRLLYFDTRGAAEPIRYFMAIHNVPYQDIRYPIQSSASGFGVDATFLAHQKDGRFRANLNKLPILQIVHRQHQHHQHEQQQQQHPQLIQQQQQQQSQSHGSRREEDATNGTIVGEIGQTHAILRYLGSQYGAVGDDLLERASIDAFVEGLQDVKAAWYAAKKISSSRCQGGGWDSSLPSSSSQPKKKDFLSIQLPDWCRKLEGSLPPLPAPKPVAPLMDPTEGGASSVPPSPSPIDASPSPWLVGNRLSVADIALYSLLSTPTSIMTGSSQSFFDGASPDTIQRTYKYMQKTGDKNNGGPSPTLACPRICLSMQAMSSLPTVRQWEDRRPDTFN